MSHETSELSADAFECGWVSQHIQRLLADLHEVYNYSDSIHKVAVH